MEFKLTSNKFMNIESNEVNNKLNELYNLCLNESLKGNKVAFYYENLNNDIFSYNQDICFYAASSIKILVCTMILRLADENKIDLNKDILVTMADLKQDTGVIKYQKEDTYYSIKKLIELCILESDNTAYLKLVDLVGRDSLEEYGKSLGALHTMEGKDNFGLINCSDMIIYWKDVMDYLKNGKYANDYKHYLLYPSVKFINRDNFIKKYGSWDIAYHEAGYMDVENPYYLIVLTQLNKMDYKEEFINKVANILDEINNIIGK